MVKSVSVFDGLACVFREEGKLYLYSSYLPKQCYLLDPRDEAIIQEIDNIFENPAGYSLELIASMLYFLDQRPDWKNLIKDRFVGFYKNVMTHHGNSELFNDFSHLFMIFISSDKKNLAMA